MPTVQIPRRQRLVLGDVSWNSYTRMLRELQGRPLRMTYDRGVLEIMTLSYEHEKEGYFLARLVDALTEELRLPVEGGKSTTFRRRKHKKGLESDGCWWIKNEHRVRGKSKIDLRFDPPPDLALEINVTPSSLNRLSIYAKLRIPEVWRYKDKKLAFLVLNEDGKYEIAETSLCFPGFTAQDLFPFLLQRSTEEVNTLISKFREWVRHHLSRKPGDHNATSSSNPSPAE